ncbi:MAG: hypothetical protein M3409_04085 [Gemmatimonadota bacterium]|nr:hypothetical protein [Gemmatimonadota bacterium]
MPLFRLLFFVLAPLALLTACTPAMQPPAGVPVPDAARLADSLQQVSLPPTARQVTFSWELNEAGNRLRGRGVARMEAPRRVRVDLFGPRGETYLAAALIGDSLRLPPAAAAITLPSPTLLWAAVGVLRPPSSARAEAAFRGDESATVHYGTDGERYVVQAGPAGLAEARRFRGTNQLESVVLTRAADGTLERARYRDWAAYRDLVLSFEATADVEAFSETIWYPQGAAR